MGGRSGKRLPPVPRRAKPDVAVLADIDASTLPGQGLSRANWTDRQIDVLTAPFTEHELEIAPEGGVYVPQVQIRKRLSKAFRVGQWGVALGKPTIVNDDPVMLVTLYVNGAPVSQAYGLLTHGLEAARSQGLVRCCKDLDMAADCWSQRWSHGFRMRWGVLVKVGDESLWRSLRSPPFEDEVGIDPRSPNKRKYRKPTQAELISSRVRMSDRPHREATLSSGSDEAADSLQPEDDRPIGKVAMRELMGAAKQHDRTETAIKRWIKSKWGHTSRSQITVSQFSVVMDWIRAPG